MSADYVLQHARWQDGPPVAIDPAQAQIRTERWWRDWIARSDKPTDWPEAVKRSLLTLRALTFLPTGGIVAAPTLGLLSEEYHVPGQQLLGNFPQALTHLSVINTGLTLCGPTLQRGGG